LLPPTAVTPRWLPQTEEAPQAVALRGFFTMPIQHQAYVGKRRSSNPVGRSGAGGAGLEGKCVFSCRTTNVVELTSGNAVQPVTTPSRQSCCPTGSRLVVHGIHTHLSERVRMALRPIEEGRSWSDAWGPSAPCGRSGLPTHTGLNGQGCGCHVALVRWCRGSLRLRGDHACSPLETPAPDVTQQATRWPGLRAVSLCMVAAPNEVGHAAGECAMTRFVFWSTRLTGLRCALPYASPEYAPRSSSLASRRNLDVAGDGTRPLLHRVCREARPVHLPHSPEYAGDSGLLHLYVSSFHGLTSLEDLGD